MKSLKTQPSSLTCMGLKCKDSMDSPCFAIKKGTPLSPLNHNINFKKNEATHLTMGFLPIFCVAKVSIISGYTKRIMRKIHTKKRHFTDEVRRLLFGVLNKEKRSGDLFQSALIIFMQLHDIAFFLPQWRF